MTNLSEAVRLDIAADIAKAKQAYEQSLRERDEDIAYGLGQAQHGEVVSAGCGCSVRIVGREYGQWITVPHEQCAYHEGEE